MDMKCGERVYLFYMLDIPADKFQIIACGDLQGKAGPVQYASGINQGSSTASDWN